jgi:hypothetical protein
LEPCASRGGSLDAEDGVADRQQHHEQDHGAELNDYGCMLRPIAVDLEIINRSSETTTFIPPGAEVLAEPDRNSRGTQRTELGSRNTASSGSCA